MTGQPGESGCVMVERDEVHLVSRSAFEGWAERFVQKLVKCPLWA